MRSPAGTLSSVYLLLVAAVLGGALLVGAVVLVGAGLGGAVVGNAVAGGAVVVDVGPECRLVRGLNVTFPDFRPTFPTDFRMPARLNFFLPVGTTSESSSRGA